MDGIIITPSGTMSWEAKEVSFKEEAAEEGLCIHANYCIRHNDLFEESGDSYGPLIWSPYAKFVEFPSLLPEEFM